jgi:hypothetical protein
MSPNLAVLLTTSVVVIGLGFVGDRVTRQVERRLVASGNPHELPSPTELAVWSPEWKDYGVVQDPELRRLAARRRWIGWAEVLIGLGGVVAYLVMW